MSDMLPGGTVLSGRYAITKLIGKGAMADVFEALDEDTRDHVAIKVLRGSVSQRDEARARFAREAEVQEKVQHPNVARLLEVGVTQDDHPFLVMELLTGRTLAHVIKREGRVAQARAVGYVTQALRGLGAVHSVGVLHRDLKPANLMLQPPADPIERVVVIDFGFASLEGGSRLTSQGFVVGSLSYMAPERLRNEIIDQRADIFSIAAVLYELLVGTRPFVGTDDVELMTAVMDRDPVPLRAASPDSGITRKLEKLVLGALDKQPSRRPRDATSFADDLERSI